MYRLIKYPMTVTVIPLTLVLACLAFMWTPETLRIGGIPAYLTFSLIGIAVYSFTYHFYVNKKLNYARYVVYFTIGCLALYLSFLLISWVLVVLSMVN